MTAIVKPDYATMDGWQAGYLDLMGAQLAWVEIDAASGRPKWVFDNLEPEPDIAFRTGREFRTAGLAIVPLQAYRDSFRRMYRAADNARREKVSNHNDLDPNND